MDRDTLQDDLDLILERTRDDELPGEWDWEPLRTGAPAATRRRPRRPASRRRARKRAIRSTGQKDEAEDEPEDEAEDDAEDEEEEDG
jgi:hypothetical protein